MSIFSKGAINFDTINFGEIDDKIKELLLSEAIKNLPDEDKVGATVDQLVQWLDDHTSYGNGRFAKWLDNNDGPLFLMLGLLIKMLVQKGFDELRKVGHL